MYHTMESTSETLSITCSTPYVLIDNSQGCVRDCACKIFNTRVILDQARGINASTGNGFFQAKCLSQANEFETYVVNTCFELLSKTVYAIDLVSGHMPLEASSKQWIFTTIVAHTPKTKPSCKHLATFHGQRHSANKANPVRFEGIVHQIFFQSATVQPTCPCFPVGVQPKLRKVLALESILYVCLVCLSDGGTAIFVIESKKLLKFLLVSCLPAANPPRPVLINCSLWFLLLLLCLAFLFGFGGLCICGFCLVCLFTLLGWCRCCWWFALFVLLLVLVLVILLWFACVGGLCQANLFHFCLLLLWFYGLFFFLLLQLLLCSLARLIRMLIPIPSCYGCILFIIGPVFIPSAYPPITLWGSVFGLFSSFCLRDFTSFASATSTTSATSTSAPSTASTSASPFAFVLLGRFRL